MTGAVAQDYLLPELVAQDNVERPRPTDREVSRVGVRETEQEPETKQEPEVKQERVPRLAKEGYSRTSLTPHTTKSVNISPIEQVEEFVKLPKQETENKELTKDEPEPDTQVLSNSVPSEVLNESKHITRPTQDDSSNSASAPVINIPDLGGSSNLEPIFELPVLDLEGEQEPIIEESEVDWPNVETPVVEEPIIETPEANYIEMTVQATMYSQHQPGLSNWTAAGYNLNETPNIIAVNPDVIPYGSVVDIEGLGVYIAGDTGSYVTWGGHYTTGIDIHTNDLDEAYQFGKQFVNIKVYPAGTDLSQTQTSSKIISEEPSLDGGVSLDDEPSYQEPIIEEPVYVEPVIEEPVIEEPVVEEPIIEEPVVEEPIIEEPIIDEPVIEDPIIEEPIIEEPVIDEPVVEEPVIEEPVVEEPVIEEPVVEEPVIEWPVVEEPVIDEPVIEEPVVEEPVVEEPVIEESVVEEPVIEEPTDYYGNYAGDLFSTANKYIGTPYVWGGKSPSGFDCSGFVYYVFMEAYGINVGGWTGEQQYAGQLISVDEAQPGDLYFWGSYGGDTYHVAIATGGGSYIHASQPGTPLGYGSVSSFTPDFAIRL